MKDFLPMGKAFIIGKELYYIAQTVLSGWLQGDGKFTKKCNAWLEKNLRCNKVLLTPSCTAALEMAALLINVEPGDEVIMPSFTFSSTANAFVLRGAIPVFVDIKRADLNIDETLIEEAITKKTKAIVVVHYAGTACEMDAILLIAKKHNLYVIEDAAQAILSEYKERKLGTLGDLGCLSFHESKNIISGEGGALLINRADLVERAEIIREKGTNRTQFLRNDVSKYSWVDVGSSYLPSEIVAAFLFAQLENSKKIIQHRTTLLRRYIKGLKPLVDSGAIRMPSLDFIDQGNAHIAYFLVEDVARRDALIGFLRTQSIGAAFHYLPLHSSLAGEKFGRASGLLGITDECAAKIVRLPLFYEMKIADVDRVLKGIYAYFESCGK